MSDLVDPTIIERRSTHRFLIGAIVVLILVKVAIFIVLALSTRIVMDEFIHFGQSTYVFDGIYRDFFPGKTIIYAVAYLPSHWLGWDAVSTLLIGRVEAALIAIATIGMIYVISRRLGQSPLRALIVVVAVLAFSTFIERGFRLRSEPVALFFATAALLVMMHEAQGSARRIFVAGMLCGLAFCCTQKAVYFNFSLGVAIVAERLWRREAGLAIRDGAVLLAGWTLVLVAYCLIFGGSNALLVVRDIFVGPMYVVQSGEDLYPGIDVFLRQTLVRNPILYFGCFLGLVLTLARYRSLNPQARIAAMFTAVLAVLVFRHNQPWPYVFTMIIPFLSLWILVPYDLFSERRGMRALMRVAAIIALVLSFIRNFQYLEHDNAVELATVRAAETLLAPHDTYFDGIGMVPTRRDVPRMWLDRFVVVRTIEEGENSTMMRRLRAAPPDLIIESYRTDALKDVLAPFLAGAYVAAVPRLLVPGTTLDAADETVFRVLETQEFDIYDGDRRASLERIAVDGVERPLPVRLEPGSYRLGPTGGRGLYRLMPASLATLPNSPLLGHPLFVEVYTD